MLAVATELARSDGLVVRAPVAGSTVVGCHTGPPFVCLARSVWRSPGRLTPALDAGAAAGATDTDDEAGTASAAPVVTLPVPSIARAAAETDTINERRTQQTFRGERPGLVRQHA